MVEYHLGSSDISQSIGRQRSDDHRQEQTRRAPARSNVHLLDRPLGVLLGRLPVDATSPQRPQDEINRRVRSMKKFGVR